MKTFLKISSLVIVLTIIIFLFLNHKNKPLVNNNKQRTEIVVISDIHLGADLAYAECNKNLAPLEQFFKQIKDTPTVKELVIGGDLLDEWFVPANVDTYNGKDQADFIERIAATNKGVVDVLNSIITEKKILVTYVPGNHDLTITAENVDLIFPGINQARDTQPGLGTYSPEDYPKIAIEHGHRYNFFCAPDQFSNPGSILPPGYFYTRIGVLSYLQNFPPAGDKLPVVTKNISGDTSQDLLFLYWNVWNRALTKYTITNKFAEPIITTNVGGLTETYSINDVLPYQKVASGPIDVKLYKNIVDTWKQREVSNHVAVDIPVDKAIIGAAKASESDDQAKIQYFLNKNSDKRIVIFGHTHEAKIIASDNYAGQKSIYANTGTWIDHNSVASTTMNFIVITPQSTDASSQTFVRLYNFENNVITKMAEDSLRY